MRNECAITLHFNNLCLSTSITNEEQLRVRVFSVTILIQNINEHHVTIIIKNLIEVKRRLSLFRLLCLLSLLSLLGSTFLFHLLTLSLGSFQSLLILQVFQLLQVFKRIWILYHVTINRDSSRTIAIVGKNLIGMFQPISTSNLELRANIYCAINNTSNFLDSLFLCVSYRLSLHIIGRNFITQFSESQSIGMLNRICCRIIEENHIIAICYIDRAIFVGSNIAGDNIHTIVFRTTTSFNCSVTDGATTLVCVHINTLSCLICRHINLILSIICHTLIASRRQQVIIDSLVKLVVLPSQGLKLIIIHS